MDAVDHDLTAEQWAALKDAWEGCAYCGATDGALQRDCVMAISRGGRYTIDNVVPACAKCNTSKCNDEVTGWMRTKAPRRTQVPTALRRDPCGAATAGGAQRGETPALITCIALTNPGTKLPSLNNSAAAATPLGADSSMPRPLTSLP